MNRLFGACGIVAVATAVLSAQAPVFRSTGGAIFVDVAVTQRGQPVTDLAIADFRLTDNGAVQAIADMSRETLPVDVALVVDLSASVRGPLSEAVRRAVETVTAALRPGDRASLAVFDRTVREVRPMTHGTLVIGPGVVPATGGQTALLDAIATVLVAPSDPARRRMAILFTDGRDLTSFLDERDLADLAGRTDVALFIVGIADGTARVPQRLPNTRLLTRLTDATGGVLTTVQRDGDLATEFRGALEDFRTRYVLRYEVTEATPVGWHAIGVAVRRKGSFEVRARRGYFDHAVRAGR